MNINIRPKRNEWESLCLRPSLNKEQLESTVKEILKEVKEKGDIALKFYTEKFDLFQLDIFDVAPFEFKEAENLLSNKLKEAIQLAKRNIEAFHAIQIEKTIPIETSQGVQCWRESRAIEKVGLYIPGGNAPLFSTILMLGIPAKIAGCDEIILCTPVNKEGKIHPAILYTAQLVGIDKVYKLGGAQAIAAMAYGTKQVPRVYKIFGPGNQYVTKAKELIQQEAIAIDMPAGPSELLLIADESCNPAFVAADLLSQAEHGPDSQVILLSNSESLITEVFAQIGKQLESLPRKEFAETSLKNSRAICLNSLDDCIDFSNLYAPEHLIIASEKADEYTSLIRNAGSVFLGNYSCESAGDYASGTNHTLPTNGNARSYSGVSLDSFIKKISFQKLSAEGIQTIGPAIEIMAEAEELFAHKNAVTLRLKSLNNDGLK